jgi:DNA-binding LacI/PurR family transcriptional regulator
MQLEIPQRVSLASRVAAAIRAGIDKQVWTYFLPGERRLCELLQVSRPTVNAALHQLAQTGLITVRHGHRNRIVSRRRRGRAARNRLVAIVTHEPLALMAATAYRGVVEMQAHLAERGFQTEIFVCPNRGGTGRHRKLEEFVTQRNVYCCVLISLRRELQQWFARHSIPALVLGSCHASVQLPSFDVDYRAVCRHAGGMFLSKGHQCMALVVPNSGGAGELASEQGFREAVETGSKAARAVAIMVRHDGTAPNIAAKLDALFNSSRPPTALLVAKPQHVFIVVIYLLQRGLAVPDTVSLIARDQDNLFANVSPPIAHYSIANNAFNHRLSRLILQLVDRGNLAAKPNLIFPRFFPGGTVKAVR